MANKPNIDRAVARASIMQMRATMTDAFDYEADDFNAKIRSERARVWEAAAEEAYQAFEYELAIQAASRAIGIMEGNL